MFSKILIANRGEVAVRIIRACREMGIATVAVYSTADENALHVALADESYCIGGREASESYLQQERIISTAMLAGAQAIHPGYGFLAENAQFAARCRENGIVFIGPSAEIMERLSDKVRLKEEMQRAGLAVIPGSSAVRDLRRAVRQAEDFGYPVMLKAASGGGGRGIRLVRSRQEMEREYPQAKAEAKAAFGDGTLYLEKYIYPARHVEFQVMADEQGHVVCLGERDCSLQRRHQKLVEEAPSPAVTAQMRARMIGLLLPAVRALGYVGVGTVEFLLDKEGRFWLMEMNLRLQVEHPVTEMLTGIDLVKWQIRIAAGVPLAFTQEDLAFSGASIECRINAAGCGEVGLLHIPGGLQVRFDTWLLQGSEVTPYYDALLGKLIVRASSREKALRKLRSALSELAIEGIPTNISEQMNLFYDDRVVTGEYDLAYMGNR
ncbi:MAG: acetyl-CoA carboxylase biotin carboxylase subunit [Eubacteriales bacterium]|nr:acetyl-CoA carboxylase biotin carboxylase subunit [Lachnospiraceae bacterium]MDO4416861.1 acetyl-CoA carboxylase biotin carboxylase subunit [Eubacteriales bacterium]